MDQTILEVGPKKGLKQAFNRILLYINFSKCMGKSVILFYNILDYNGQTWIDVGDK